MRFQHRDGEILKAIYENDGVLARRHIKDLFWPNSTWRAMEKRLSKLYKADYIVWPSKPQHKMNPIPEPICWLGWRGAEFIAGENGVNLDPLKSISESKLRVLQKFLKDNGIRWVREPSWSILRHNLAIVDFRIAMQNSISQIRHLTIENWKTEYEFRKNMDTIEFYIKDKNQNKKNIKKGIRPDAYFEIIDHNRCRNNQDYRARFLLELDMATHGNPRFGIEKARAGAAYIKSPAYKERFGYNSGYWLIVTVGNKTRIKNLKKQTEENVELTAVGLFYFTSLKDIKDSNVLESPIWRKVGSGKMIPLLPS